MVTARRSRSRFKFKLESRLLKIGDLGVASLVRMLAHAHSRREESSLSLPLGVDSL